MRYRLSPELDHELRAAMRVAGEGAARAAVDRSAVDPQEAARLARWAADLFERAGAADPNLPLERADEVLLRGPNAPDVDAIRRQAHATIARLRAALRDIR